MPDYEFLQVNINTDIDGELSQSPLPETLVDEDGSCNDINMLEKKTKAPARFTEATLLKETDGIGMAAAQAGIIKELIDSGMLIKKDKYLISSFKFLINAFSSTKWESHKYFRKNMWGKRKLFLNLIAGSHGDNSLIRINVVPFPNIVPLPSASILITWVRLTFSGAIKLSLYSLFDHANA